MGLNNIMYYSLFLLLQACAGFVPAEQGTSAPDNFMANHTACSLGRACPRTFHAVCDQGCINSFSAVRPVSLNYLHLPGPVFSRAFSRLGLATHLCQRCTSPDPRKQVRINDTQQPGHSAYVQSRLGPFYRFSPFPSCPDFITSQPSQH